MLLWEGAVQQFFSPAEQALVPRLVRDDELLVANALSGQVSDAVLLASVRTSGRGERRAPGGRRLAAVAGELLDGLRLSARHPLLRALMAFLFVTSVGEGIMGTLIVPFVRQVLHGSSQAFGLVTAAQAIGGITGGLLAASLSQRVPASRLFCYGAVAFGLVDLAIFLYPLGYAAVWPAIIGMIIVGLPGALTIAGLITLFQRGTADSHRGRVFGALGAIEGTAVLAGTLAAGYLSRPLGIIPVLVGQGAGYVLAGLAMTAWLRDTFPAAAEPAGASSRQNAETGLAQERTGTAASSPRAAGPG